MDFNNQTKLFVFIAITFAISWVTAFFMYYNGIVPNTPPAMLMVAVCYLCSPAISALLVQKIYYEKPLSDIGFTFKHTTWKQVISIPCIYLLWVFVFLMSVFIAGNLLHLGGWGELTFASDAIHKNILKTIVEKDKMEVLKNLPSVPILFLMTILSPLLLGASLRVLLGLGQELGWRGFLQHELSNFSLPKRNFMIGFLQGIWYIPLVVLQHETSTDKLIGIVLMVLYCVSFSFLVGSMYQKIKTIWAIASFQAMVAFLHGSISIFFLYHSDWISSVLGVAGILTNLVVYFLFHTYSKNIPFFYEKDSTTI